MFEPLMILSTHLTSSLSMNMKKFVLLTAVIAMLSSCGSKDRGELVGVKGKKWHPEKPYGMDSNSGWCFYYG